MAEFISELKCSPPTRRRSSRTDYQSIELVVSTIKMFLGVIIFWDFFTSHMQISKLPSRDQVTNIHSYLISLYLLFFLFLFSTRRQVALHIPSREF